MFVRTGSEQDLAAVGRLIEAALHATGDALYGSTNVEIIARSLYAVSPLRVLTRRPTSEFLVADDGAAIGGVAIAAAAVEAERTVDILAFFVRPDLQGRGIGGMLLQELEESFFESEWMRVEVDARNLRALGFVEGQGYVRTGERRDTALEATLVMLEKSLI